MLIDRNINHPVSIIFKVLRIWIQSKIRRYSQPLPPSPIHIMCWKLAVVPIQYRGLYALQFMM